MKFTQIDVQRKLTSNENVNRLGKINILHYTPHEQSNKENIFKYQNIKISSIISSSPEEFLWQYSWFLKDSLPNWSSSMQLIHSHIQFEFAGKTSITFLPIIDLTNCNFPP